MVVVFVRLVPLRHPLYKWVNKAVRDKAGQSVSQPENQPKNRQKRTLEAVPVERAVLHPSDHD